MKLPSMHSQLSAFFDADKVRKNCNYQYVKVLSKRPDGGIIKTAAVFEFLCLLWDSKESKCF